MAQTSLRWFLALGLALSLGACGPTGRESEPSGFPEFRGDEASVSLAVSEWVQRGKKALPALRAGLRSDSVQVRAACRRALGLITGQWGGGAGLVWKRSVVEARNQTKPLMVLHLFGKFDEEFC